MGEINISRDEQAALEKIDQSNLSKLVDRAIDTERTGDLYHLRYCGAFVAAKLHSFERAMTAYAAAKSVQKRAETKEEVKRAGQYLMRAITQMQERLETEKKEGELFYVDEDVYYPTRYTKRMSVAIGYRWRRTTNDTWSYCSITFHHEAQLRPNYAAPVPRRKPSASQQAQAEQHKLQEIWDDLRRGALHSVKQFFRDGGNGAEIPKECTATYDVYSGHLNNYSTQFWRKQP